MDGRRSRLPSKKGRIITADREVCRVLYTKSMQIKRLIPGDEEIAYRTISELKLKGDRTPENFDYIHRLISLNTNYLIIALDKNILAGFLIAYELPRIDCNKNMMLFYEIEVAETYQRQGVGKKLIDKLKEICREKDFLKMWVLTNESNVAAMNLYKSTGGVQSEIPEILFEYFAEY